MQTVYTYLKCQFIQFTKPATFLFIREHDSTDIAQQSDTALRYLWCLLAFHSYHPYAMTADFFTPTQQFMHIDTQYFTAHLYVMAHVLVKINYSSD